MVRDGTFKTLNSGLNFTINQLDNLRQGTWLSLSLYVPICKVKGLE